MEIKILAMAVPFLLSCTHTPPSKPKEIVNNRVYQEPIDKMWPKVLRRLASFVESRKDWNKELQHEFSTNVTKRTKGKMAKV